MVLDDIVKAQNGYLKIPLKSVLKAFLFFMKLYNVNNKAAMKHRTKATFSEDIWKELSHRLFMPINPQNTVAVSIKIIPFLLFVICDNCNYSEHLFHSRFSLVNLLI